MNLRWSSLLFFVIQHSVLTIGLRYSTVYSDPDVPYISSTVVFLTELLKLILSFLVCLLVDARGNVGVFLTILEKGMYLT